MHRRRVIQLSALLIAFIVAAVSVFPTAPVAADEWEYWYKGDITIEANVLWDDAIDCLAPKLRSRGRKHTVSTRCSTYVQPTRHSAQMIVRLMVEDSDYNDITRDSCTAIIPKNLKQGSFTLECSVFAPR